MPRVTFLCACVIVLAGAAPAFPQEDAAAPKATLTIDNAMAPPAWELRVPVTLAVPAVLDVGRLRARITYPTDMIEFEKVQATNTLKEAGFDLKVEGIKPTGKTAAVQIETIAAFKKGQKLPNGVIAILVFKVGNDAKEGDQFSVAAEDVHAWGRTANSPEVKAGSAGPSTVTVAPAGLPIFNCFFYMH